MSPNRLNRQRVKDGFRLQIQNNGGKIINAVGIDVSKGKSMVCVMRPFGEVVLEPFEVLHTTQNLRNLAGKL